MSPAPLHGQAQAWLQVLLTTYLMLSFAATCVLAAYLLGYLRRRYL